MWHDLTKRSIRSDGAKAEKITARKGLVGWLARRPPSRNPHTYELTEGTTLGDLVEGARKQNFYRTRKDAKAALDRRCPMDTP